MKKKEREHLKEDPFQHFIENALEIFKKYKKYILGGGIAVLSVAIIVGAIVFFHFQSVKSTNQVLTEAITIQNDAKLTIDEKIEKLSALDNKGGVNTSIQLHIAALYFEKGDLAAAKECLGKIPDTKYELLNHQKTLLDAEILMAEDKPQEALDLLSKLITNPQAEVAKDYILLKMAKIQAKIEQKDTAVTNLNKIIEEYPQSAYAYEARAILTELENK